MPEQQVKMIPADQVSTVAAGEDHVFDIPKNNRVALYNIVMDGDDTEATGEFQVNSRHEGFTKLRPRGTIDLVAGPFDLSFQAIGVNQIVCTDIDYDGTESTARLYLLEA